MSHALLLLDYQEGLCRRDSQLAPALGAAVADGDVIGHAQRALEAARERDGVTPIHVRVAFDPAYHLRTNRSAGFDPYEANRLLQADSPEAAFVSELAPAPGEVVIDKGWVDPFIGTPLLSILNAQRIETLFLGGVATNFVVESAARTGGDLGFRVFVVEQLCASFASELHDFSLRHIVPLFGEAISLDRYLELAGRER